MIKEIDSFAKEIIHTYMNLKVDGKTIQTPYFINSNRTKDLRAMVGKGTPDEIIMEAKIWEKLKGVDFDSMTKEEIKAFLIDRGIGIDCSGFIVHVLDYWFKSKNRKHIWNKFNIGSKSLFNILKYKLRPAEKLGADLITNAKNCTAIELKDIMPGDLIRSKSIKINGDHIMIIYSTEYEGDNLKKIIYAHSTPNFDEENGVKFGVIEITNINEPLENQNWLEVDKQGNTPTLEGYKINIEDNGIRRLKFIQELVK